MAAVGQRLGWARPVRFARYWRLSLAAVGGLGGLLTTKVGLHLVVTVFVLGG